MTRRWSRYLRLALGLLAGGGLAVFAFVALVDPYDSLWFSPAAEREPISTNQRYSFPALARSDRFDSAVFGTSTTRLLRPAQLDGLFGARFANLSMNSATAYEQSELHALFLRHHPRPDIVVYGIDSIWCAVEDAYVPFTFRPFPPWLYDEDRWNDLLYLFNFKAIEAAGQQFAFLTGIKDRRYGADGYTDFLPPQAEYDLARARQNIYGPAGPPAPDAPLPTGPVPGADEIAGWTYATHALMRAMLAAAPAETLKILVFVPYHASQFERTNPLQQARLAECKRRLTAIAQDVPNSVVLDFMIPSIITRDDARYWDSLHYNVETAAEIAAAIARGAADRRSEDGLFVYLGGSPPPDGAALTDR
ncbi:MAG: hypothetical protein R3F55_06915 [Alphaproteobacteria bacterium]